MNTHTNTEIKLKKQIFLIDIFYDKYKENLYNIFTKRHPHHNKDGCHYIERSELSHNIKRSKQF